MTSPRPLPLGPVISSSSSSSPSSGSSFPPASSPSSPPSLSHIPSLTADYSHDASDPDPQLSIFLSLALFGSFTVSQAPSDDPRYRALAKFRSITKQHGIDDISVPDYVRALRVYAAMVDRNAKNALKRRRRQGLPGDPVTRRRPPLYPDSRSDGCQSDDAISDRWSLPDTSSDFQRHDSGETMNPPDTQNEKNGEVCAEHVQLLYHMLRHAESIYGFPITVPSAPGITLTKLTDRAIICRRTGIDAADIKLASFANSAFLPAHYVAIDKHIRAVVICVRGTANIVDSLTDIAATQDPFAVREIEGGTDVRKGYGHAGVIRSARNLFARIRSVTLEALTENQGFELMITGHSLGAATAAVLAMIMRDDPTFPKAVAFSFAPLPCLSEEIVELTDEFVVTLVNGPDIVPRLSVAVLLPFIATARYVKDMSAKRKAMVAVGLRSMAVKWDELNRHNEETVKDLQKHHEGRRLFIPGRVFQLVQRNEVNRRDVAKNRLFRKTEVEVVPVQRANFLEVRGRERGMFLSHAPFNYKSKLTLALKGLGSETLKVMQGGSVFRNLLTVPVAKFLSTPGKRDGSSWDQVLNRLVGDNGRVIPISPRGEGGSTSRPHSYLGIGE